VDKEINQGITLATLAKEFGVKHFLYSSVAGAHLNCGVPHFESKFKIENHIRKTVCHLPLSGRLHCTKTF
jgi:uncharacterized protein YbjT (DUF2867 family)